MGNYYPRATHIELVMKYSKPLLRAFDLAISATALCVLSPIMALIAVAILLETGGPVLFRQTRIGRGGRPFTILKFRSMYRSDSMAQTSQGEVRGDDIRAARGQFRTTVPNDPRITPVGRFLRSTHLDELPQFINVLKGDMSLVGVRPDTPAQEADYEPGYWIKRHALRPGITGPAQIRSVADIGERTEFETLWLEKPTMTQYLTVLGATCQKVLRRTSF